MRRLSGCLKVVGALLALVFVVEQVSWADPARHVLAPPHREKDQEAMGWRAVKVAFAAVAVAAQTDEEIFAHVRDAIHGFPLLAAKINPDQDIFVDRGCCYIQVREPGGYTAKRFYLAQRSPTYPLQVVEQAAMELPNLQGSPVVHEEDLIDPKDFDTMEAANHVFHELNMPKFTDFAASPSEKDKKVAVALLADSLDSFLGDVKSRLLAPWAHRMIEYQRQRNAELASLLERQLPQICDLALDVRGVEKWEAAKASLAGSRRSTALAPVAGTLPDTGTRVWENAVATLARLNSPKAIAPLAGMLRDSDARTRHAAAEALAHFEDPLFAVMIMDALKQNRIGVPDRDALEGLLMSDRPSDRKAASQILREASDTTIVARADAGNSSQIGSKEMIALNKEYGIIADAISKELASVKDKETFGVGLFLGINSFWLALLYLMQKMPIPIPDPIFWSLLVCAICANLASFIPLRDWGGRRRLGQLEKRRDELLQSIAEGVDVEKPLDAQGVSGEIVPKLQELFRQRVVERALSPFPVKVKALPPGRDPVSAAL